MIVVAGMHVARARVVVAAGAAVAIAPAGSPGFAAVPVLMHMPLRSGAATASASGYTVPALRPSARRDASVDELHARLAAGLRRTRSGRHAPSISIAGPGARQRPGGSAAGNGA